MKNFFKYFLIIVFFGVWGVTFVNKSQTGEIVQKVRTVVQKELNINQPCSRPLTFSIGKVDPNFNISKDDFILIAKEAVEFWNKEAGKNVFKYDSNSEFKINLIYDIRQTRSDAAEDLNANLENLETTHEKIISQYESIQAEYEKKLKKYNEDLEKYKKKLEKYNKQVEYWNSRGGAPEDEYEDLKDLAEDLEDLYDDLKKQQKEINKLAGKSNNLVEKENDVVSEYNSSVSTYKNLYGGTQEFEKGVFSGKEINIYQFVEKNDLKMTLIHELGHYLGLNHTENSKSIMYYLMGDQDLENPVFSNEDIVELNRVCGM